MFIDGPPHDDPAQAVADTSVREALVRDGYKVVVFHHQLTDWLAVVRANSQIFGIEGTTAGANQ